VPELPRVEGQDVNFEELASDGMIPEGRFEVVVTVEGGAQQEVLVDDLTLSTPEDLARASVHRRVKELPATERADLVAFVEQLDQASAPSDSAILPASQAVGDLPAMPAGAAGSSSGRSLGGLAAFGVLDLLWLVLALGVAVGRSWGRPRGAARRVRAP
jgi:hypothetical protein